MTDTTPAAVEALPIETAPKNGTMLRLLVDYTDEGENPLEDKHQAWTIGFNQLSDTEEDVWEFAGWSWEQDCFTAGIGKAIGWLPFHHSARDLVPALAAERDAALALNTALTEANEGLGAAAYLATARAEKAETEAAALRDEVARLREAMRFGCSAAINSLHDESGTIPEWSESSGIWVMLAALGCHGHHRLNETVRAALTSKGGEG